LFIVFALAGDSTTTTSVILVLDAWRRRPALTALRESGR
jgi:hypothetical protein